MVLCILWCFWLCIISYWSCAAKVNSKT